MNNRRVFSAGHHRVTRSEYVTNKIMLSFGLALAGEILLAWLESFVRDIGKYIIIGQLAPWIALAGAPLMALALWKAHCDRKHPNPCRYWTGLYLLIPALLLSVTGLLMCYDVSIAIRAMYVIFPCAAGLDLIYELYQRPCFLSCIFLLGTGAGLWLLTRLDSVGLLTDMATVAAALAFCCILSVLLVRRRDGMFFFSLRLLPEGSEYGALLVTVLVGLFCFVAAIFLPTLVSAALVRYLLYLILAYTLGLLGYYTVKLM